MHMIHQPNPEKNNKPNNKGVKGKSESYEVINTELHFKKRSQFNIID